MKWLFFSSFFFFPWFRSKLTLVQTYEPNTPNFLSFTEGCAYDAYDFGMSGPVNCYSLFNGVSIPVIFI